MLIENKGTMIRTKVDQISVIGRNTQGVKVVTTREAEMLVDAVGFKESLDEEEVHNFSAGPAIYLKY